MNGNTKNIITLRSLTEDDLPRAAELWLACFPEDDAEFVSYYFSRRTKPSNLLGLFEDGSLVSMLSFEEMKMYACGAPDGVQVSFVAGVCTEPGKRRRGYVRRLFARLEELLKERGVQALLLVPFDFGFYEKLGFAPYAVREVIEYNASEAPAGYEEIPVSPELLSRVYGAYMAGREGALLRPAAYSEALLEEYRLPGAHAAAVRTEDAEAYCLFWDGADGEADEFAFTSRSAASALAALAAERFGISRFPIPAVGAGERFNMIKLLDQACGFLLDPERKPFDFRKY
ncbi:MAG: GNAT family N-acetyltransferase [Clostridia bacterium]|nr:GNAT family N-acetyltransferase [Clostridia bacterium]